MLGLHFGGGEIVKYNKDLLECHVTQLKTSHLTRHTSHVTRHTSHVTRHTSHLTPHTSHLTPHTSHLTPHTSHVTLHTDPSGCSLSDACSRRARRRSGTCLCQCCQWKAAAAASNSTPQASTGMMAPWLDMCCVSIKRPLPQVICSGRIKRGFEF